MKSLFKGLIILYQYTLRPFLGSNCRFYPSCSNYAKEAIDKHGALKGAAYALIRICKCGPWHPGGIDKP